jgi:hypothetical protein
LINVSVTTSYGDQKIFRLPQAMVTKKCFGHHKVWRLNFSNYQQPKKIQLPQKGGHVICYWKFFDNFPKTYDTPPFLSDLKKNWSPSGNGGV